MLTDASAPVTVGETAYGRIRSDIIFGRLPPGQKLKLDQLKNSYRFSVSTLREILNRLSSELLVLAEGQRGFEVSPVSRENLKEIAALRQLLEVSCHRAIICQWGCRVGRASGRRASQAFFNGRTDEGRRPQRNRTVEAV